VVGVLLQHLLGISNKHTPGHFHNP
jgi:hypothetical protein